MKGILTAKYVSKTGWRWKPFHRLLPLSAISKNEHPAEDRYAVKGLAMTSIGKLIWHGVDATVPALNKREFAECMFVGAYAVVEANVGPDIQAQTITTPTDPISLSTSRTVLMSVVGPWVLTG